MSGVCCKVICCDPVCHCRGWRFKTQSMPNIHAAGVNYLGHFAQFHKPPSAQGTAKYGNRADLLPDLGILLLGPSGSESFFNQANGSGCWRPSLNSCISYN